MHDERDVARGVGSPLSLDKTKDEVLTESLPGGWSERREAARQEGRDRLGRRRTTAAERAELLEALERSGQSVADFAAAQGLRESTIYGWQQRRRAVGKQIRPARRGHYSAEERLAAVEAYRRSGRTQADFARLWGVSVMTLSKWLQRHAEGGGQALVTQRRGGPGRPRTIAPEVREEIARTKARFPDFGLRRVRDWLLRFRGISVSAGTVKSALQERGIASAPRAKKRLRVVHPPRRFERARPMQLWQTDITSFKLTRHSVRVYLVVFLDDHSRYVVSWSLCTHQKNEMVAECLLDGIARFGKPEEVLSDQGPQYHSWRGKSAFDKLLDREGIRHVVARTHHPQTVGKCERLWKTVGTELWERAKPQDLSEARARLAHYFAHYNHFRPHQGIEGLVPADRFFEAERAARETIEKELAANELALALSREPRRPVYLFGRIGEQQVSLVGEHGRVVVHTDEGALRELEVESQTTSNETQEDTRDGRDEHDPERADDDAPAHAHGPQAHALPDAAPAGGVGARAVARGELGGAAPGARALDGDPRVLAGQELEGGDRAPARGAGGAGLAALAARALGDARGAPAAAEVARAGASLDRAERPGERSAHPEAAHPGAAAQAGADGGPGACPEGPALGSEGSADDGAGAARWEDQAQSARVERAPWGAGIPRS